MYITTEAQVSIEKKILMATESTEGHEKIKSLIIRLMFGYRM